MGSVLTNIVEGQCDKGVKKLSWQKSGYAKALSDGDIIKVLIILSSLFTEGSSSQVNNPILWYFTQLQRMLNFMQIPKKDTESWIQELGDKYDNIHDLGWPFPFSESIMIVVLEEQVGAGTTIYHYHDTSNMASVPEWYLEY